VRGGIAEDVAPLMASRSLPLVTQGTRTRGDHTEGRCLACHHCLTCWLRGDRGCHRSPFTESVAAPL